MTRLQTVRKHLKKSTAPIDLQWKIEDYVQENDRYCTVEERAKIRGAFEGSIYDQQKRKELREYYKLSRNGLCKILSEKSRVNDAKRIANNMNQSNYDPG